jgi:hypothetical protein
MDLKLEYNQVTDMKNELINFYSSINDITDYYLQKKLDKLNQRDYTVVDNLLFDEYDVDPMDMDISIDVIDSNLFTNYSQQIATFTIESQIGRQISFGIKENHSGKYLGFTRISSPVSSIKPRNDMYGSNLPLSLVNQHFYNGQTIVPVQPFGFNYLGGKLISLMCVSNEVRELYNEKYNTEICVFETTSLYGNAKSSSMYDGLEPYIRFKGLTQSKNTLSPTDDIYHRIRTQIREKYGVSEWNGMIVNPKPSNPKGRELTKCIQIIKDHLKVFDQDEYLNFTQVMKEKSITLQQKRYYNSNMGFNNVPEFINGSTKLTTDNQQKYDTKNLIDYWKKKSHNRWSKLKQENKLQTDLQYYTKDNIKDGIDFKIIR